MARKGSEGRRKFLSQLPAMGRLVGAIQNIVNGVRSELGVWKQPARNYLVGLDGRHISVRSAHAALNSLLQSAGAVLMKRALVILYKEARMRGIQFDFCANVHDEWQADVEPTRAEEFGTIAADSIRWAGEFYSFKCPLKGNYVIGNDWASTH